MLVYFNGSWILGLIMLFLMFYFNDDEFYTLIFIVFTSLNVIINFIFILFQTIMIYVFPENREEFFKSILILLFNFPFLIALTTLFYLFFALI